MIKLEKSIKTSTWLGVIFLICAIFCLGAYTIIGQEIDAQGFLQEPFFLVPLFWLFLLLGVITVVVNVITRIVRSNRRKTTAG
ncbi:DUF3955 domain-containing protein [Chloroflexota bacterium]|nr:DUF3955 domain-containing protein [Chloroflexota bacterium]